MMQITMPRGDLRPIEFQVNLQKVPYTEFDEIYFTVKKTVSNKEFVIQKTLSGGDIILDDGSYTFNIEPEDTDDLDYGTYVFDIELIKVGEIKQTFVGQFTLTSEVTFAENE